MLEFPLLFVSLPECIYCEWWIWRVMNLTDRVSFQWIEGWPPPWPWRMFGGIDGLGKEKQREGAIGLPANFGVKDLFPGLTCLCGLLAGCLSVCVCLFVCALYEKIQLCNLQVAAFTNLKLPRSPMQLGSWHPTDPRCWPLRCLSVANTTAGCSLPWM